MYDRPGWNARVDEDGKVRPGKWSSKCAHPCHFWRNLGPPSTPIYEEVKTMCGKCAHCLWVLRSNFSVACELERGDNDHCLFVTLTISPEGVDLIKDREGIELADKLLDIGLPQGWMKRLRKNASKGHGSFKGRDTRRIRYVMVGEYGSLKGRAHYHFLLFIKGDVPDWRITPNGQRAHDRFAMLEWPYGHVTAVPVFSNEAAWYISKYLRKSDTTAQVVKSRSSRPSIGGDAAYRMGAAVAEMGSFMAAHNFSVRIAGLYKDRKGILTGANREHFLRGYCDYHGQPISFVLDRVSPSVVPLVERMVKKEVEAELLKEVARDQGFDPDTDEGKAAFHRARRAIRRLRLGDEDDRKEWERWGDLVWHKRRDAFAASLKARVPIGDDRRAVEARRAAQARQLGELRRPVRRYHGPYLPVGEVLPRAVPLPGWRPVRWRDAPEVQESARLQNRAVMASSPHGGRIRGRAGVDRGGWHGFASAQEVHDFCRRVLAESA